jgi:hypothetical protein
MPTASECGCTKVHFGRPTVLARRRIIVEVANLQVSSDVIITRHSRTMALRVEALHPLLLALPPIPPPLYAVRSAIGDRPTLALLRLAVVLKALAVSRVILSIVARDVTRRVCESIRATITRNSLG